MKHVIFLLTVLFSVTSLADKSPDYIPNQSSVNSVEKMSLINSLYHWINQASENPELISKATLDNFFQPDITYIVNGKLLASNTNELSNHLKKLVSMSPSTQAVMPLDKVIVANNEAAITYRINHIDSIGKSNTNDATILITFQENKINNWQAIISHQTNQVLEQDHRFVKKIITPN